MSPRASHWLAYLKSKNYVVGSEIVPPEGFGVLVHCGDCVLRAGELSGLRCKIRFDDTYLFYTERHADHVETVALWEDVTSISIARGRFEY